MRTLPLALTLLTACSYTVSEDTTPGRGFPPPGASVPYQVISDSEICLPGYCGLQQQLLRSGDDPAVIGETCSAWTAQELQPIVDDLAPDEALIVLSLESSLEPDGDSELLGVFVDGAVVHPWIVPPAGSACGRPRGSSGVGVVRALVGEDVEDMVPSYDDRPAQVGCDPGLVFPDA
jgi:hypothetical protein